MIHKKQITKKTITTFETPKRISNKQKKNRKDNEKNIHEESSSSQLKFQRKI